MINTHDPYLNTVKRSLNEAKIKIRKNKIKKTEVIKKSFFSKSIIISDYIYLPESLQKIFLLSIFILIPYFFGTVIILILIGNGLFKEGITFSFDFFMLSWTIGYETIAFILLMFIIKSAFSFNRN